MVRIYSYAVQLTQITNQSNVNMNPTQLFKGKPVPYKLTVQTTLTLSNLPKMAKQWKLIDKKPGQHSQKIANASVELAYNKALAKAKHLLAHYSQLVFEKDQREDKEDSFAMHSFMSATFFIRLECDAQLNYRLQYAFCNCFFEAELRALLSSHPLDHRAREITLSPDHTTFYNNVLKYQSKQYITQL
jgi:hypothetical protein